MVDIVDLLGSPVKVLSGSEIEVHKDSKSVLKCV